ncbi:Uncharacterised protein [Mycobacterium tuberculosis]|nr:Uncharacterised protein [Mycobacterium tuberculosis]
MHANPTAMSAVPTNSTTRRPSFGTYQNDNAEKMPSGTMNGPNAIAVVSGEYPMICWTYCMPT